VDGGVHPPLLERPERHAPRKHKQVNYQKAAFLASTYKAPGIQTAQWGGIQPQSGTCSARATHGGANPAINSSEAYWLNQADSWYNNGGARPSISRAGRSSRM
jgi:hypothetical protein